LRVVRSTTGHEHLGAVAARGRSAGSHTAAATVAHYAGVGSRTVTSGWRTGSVSTIVYEVLPVDAYVSLRAGVCPRWAG